MITPSPAFVECPACRRHVGALPFCPYCDLRIPLPPALRLIKAAAFLLAGAGLLRLWLADPRPMSAAMLDGLNPAETIRHVLPGMAASIAPHLHWMLWSVMIFMLMAAPPAPATSGPAGWRRLLYSCRPGGAGLLVFLLSGLLGCIIMHQHSLTAGDAFQGFTPALAGLFLVPGFVFSPISSLFRLHRFSSNGRGLDRGISAAALIGLGLITITATGLYGLTSLLTAAGIGMLPFFYGARRRSSLGMILLPMACLSSGMVPAVASLLRLQ